MSSRPQTDRGETRPEEPASTGSVVYNVLMISLDTGTATGEGPIYLILESGGATLQNINVRI